MVGECPAAHGKSKPKPKEKILYSVLPAVLQDTGSEPAPGTALNAIPRSWRSKNAIRRINLYISPDLSLAD